RLGRGRNNNNRARNDNSESDYIPKELFDNLNYKQRKWMLDGRHMASKRQISGTTAAAGRETDEEESEADESSASSRFGREGKDRSLQNNKKQRSQKSFTSTTRRMAATRTHRFDSPSDYALRARSECDSRADTVCAGASFKLLELTEKVCDVGGFHESFKNLKVVPIATTATAYDHGEMQETLILVFNQSLYFGNTMEHSLLSPNQLRSNGLVVDSCPRQFSNGKSMHGIYIGEEDISLPFQMHAVFHICQLAYLLMMS
ncbi:MAG: hypothetical protein ACREBR_01155, partial [bacterium]